MPKFSTTSLERLETCCEPLQEIMHRVIKVYDFTILEGRRNEETQNRYYKAGKSKLRYPRSKHNGIPSEACDICPWPIDWDDIEAFCYLGGLVVATGASLGHKIRWGGNWDMDNVIMHDQKFQDLVHFEYAGPM
jgi:peptidoglycan LD-endopeptidase CwlK